MHRIRSWPGVFRLAGEALLPPVCLVCGGAGRGRLDCCAGCEDELPALATHCRRCGLALAAESDGCGQCLRRRPAFDRTWPGFAYRDEIEALVRRFKFHRDLAAGRLLALLLARQLAARRVPRPDLVVPVPLHWRRWLGRGFNQAELLCRDLSAALGRLPWHRALKRTRPTAAQSGLPAAGRGRNVRGAFALTGLPAGVRRVALVDDVMTTGATLGECARVLGRAGVGQVDVWVIARA